MKISPMDIQRQGLNRRFRGFDSDEVQAYLALVAEEVAALQREHDDLEHQVRHLQLIVDEHRGPRGSPRRPAPPALTPRLTSLLDLQEEAELEDNLRFLKRREEAGGRG